MGESRGCGTVEPRLPLANHEAEVPAAGAELAFGLDCIRRQIDWWRDYDKASRDREGLSTTEATHIVSPPTWPSHGQLANWSALLQRACQTLGGAA